MIKIIRLLRFERVYLPLYKVADTPFDLRRQIIIVPLDFDFLFFCFSVMKVRLNLGKESVWIIPSNTSLPARPATAAEITNDLDHQGEMYTRYRYKRRELYKVGHSKVMSRS